MLAAKRDIAVVAANFRLSAFLNGMALCIDPEVHRRLAPAFTDGFQFDKRVGNAEQGCRAGKQLRLKIGAQAISNHRNLGFIGQPSELKHLIPRQELGLIDPKRFEFCWIVDFPMFEMNEETNHVDFSHNPFSMPQGGLEALETKDPLDILAYQYDIVCNGVELSSGAIRNHRPEIMYKAFEIAGYSQEDVDTNFAGMINAFKYGAPPHGGSAPGMRMTASSALPASAVKDFAVCSLMGGVPSGCRPMSMLLRHVKVGDGAFEDFRRHTHRFR